MKKTKKDQCEICGRPAFWDGQVLPLDIIFVDGNPENTRKGNRRLACPNCHSQHTKAVKGGSLLFLVLHHEIMGPESDYRADEMAFHVARTFNDAISYIRLMRVSEYSWWEIQSVIVGDFEWPHHVGYYGRRGGLLKAPPYEKCVELFKKARRAGDPIASQ